MNLRFETAAIAIFVAMVFDSLDGRVARLTRTQSEFGAEYDSLSDMVSFGVAPALVVYEWGLKGLGKAGWFAAFVYCACAALRLARFNTNIDVVDKRFFQGMPSPAAAGLVAGFILTMETFQVAAMDGVVWWAWIITTAAGITMVSNVPFYSGKDINIRKSVPFRVMVLIAMVVVAVALLSSNLPEMIFTMLVIYGLSGYVMWGLDQWKRRPARPEPPAGD
jgi:CDP-diacylglycerol--serine O-phosphatidyltransferase